MQVVGDSLKKTKKDKSQSGASALKKQPKSTTNLFAAGKK